MKILKVFDCLKSWLQQHIFDPFRIPKIRKYFFIFPGPWSPCSAACSIFAIASCFSTWAFSSFRLRSVIKSDSTSSAISKFQSLNFKKFKCLSDRAMIRSLFLQILARLRHILTQSQKSHFQNLNELRKENYPNSFQWKNTMIFLHLTSTEFSHALGAGRKRWLGLDFPPAPGMKGFRLDIGKWWNLWS